MDAVSSFTEAIQVLRQEEINPISPNASDNHALGHLMNHVEAFPCPKCKGNGFIFSENNH